MIIYFVDGVYVVDSQFNDRNTVKSCGFRWHVDTDCRFKRKGCLACKAEINRRWWSDSSDAAKKLSRIKGVDLDESAKKKLDAITTAMADVSGDIFSALCCRLSNDSLKRLYRLAALDCHPDRGGNEDAMKMVNAAWDRLCKIRGI